MGQRPIVNTHTHIFTEKNIPPLIAKTFLPWPFYWLVHFEFIFLLFKLYKWIRNKLRPIRSFRTWVISLIRSFKLSWLINSILGWYLTMNIASYILDWGGLIGHDTILGKAISKLK